MSAPAWVGIDDGVQDGTLTGQTALVTGAGSGLGRATALALAAAGADCAVVGRSIERLSGVTEQIRALGRRVVAIPLDLADSAVLDAAVDDAVGELGRLDVLVNAAATDRPGSAGELALADWQRVQAVNVTAPFVLSRAAMRHMRGAGGGLIVNVSSVAGRRGWPNASAYCTSKFALSGLTQALAAEGRADGIRVCVLYPGAMTTAWGTFDEDRAGLSEPDAADVRRSLDPATVADLVVWMAAAPGRPVLNEVTVTPLLEQGWP